MILSDWMYFIAIVLYFLLGSYAIFLHKLYGWTLTLGLIALSGLNLSTVCFGTWEELLRVLARALVIYSIWKLIKHRNSIRYDKEA